MIGVFDSGYGGLAVLQQCLVKLPEYDFVYLGDNARAPYGDLAPEQVRAYTRQGVDFLLQQGCELVVLACNTASASALKRIQQEFLPAYYPEQRVLGVVRPLAEEAAFKAQQGPVVALGTSNTIRSQAYNKEIGKIKPQLKLSGVACPGLVPLIEQNATKGGRIRRLLDLYLARACQTKPELLIPACTHYSLIGLEIKKRLPLGVTVLNGPAVIAGKLKKYLAQHIELRKRLKKGGARIFYTTGNTNEFARLADQLAGIDATGTKKANFS